MAFAGTLHLAEDYSQLEAAYAEAAAGRLPDGAAGRGLLPLADRPVDPRRRLRRHRVHTLTYFGLHTPGRAVRRATRPATKAEAVRRAIAAIDEHLDEPLESCLATDADGRPCIEAKIPQDVEADLAMPGGHIFHGDLDWPWAPNRARLDTPAQQWGVQTDLASVLLCGSGRPPRRRGLGPRRPQRRPGRARLPVGRRPDFSRAPGAGNVHVASPRAALAQLAEQLTLNQRVRGSSP